jgi:hypothetical protein
MAGKWTERLQEIASVSEGSWTNIVPKTVLLPVIALFASLADAIGALFGIPINVADALGESIGGLVDATIGGSGDIISAGAQESIDSIGSGVWAQFGPFTFIVAIGVVIAAAYIVSVARAEEETSNFWFFLPFDVPILGTEEDGEGGGG